MPIHISIDARIAYYNASGLRRYLMGLLGGLAEESLAPLELTVLQSWKERSSLSTTFSPGWLLTPPHHRFERFFLSLEMQTKRVDLIHSIDFFSPIKGTPQLLTVHDLYFLRDKNVLDEPSWRHYRQVLDYARNAVHIVCISHATRKDLIDAAGLEDERVSVIYPGLPLMDEDEPAPVQSPDSREDIILAVGTLEPRKNYPAMIRAYARAYESSPRRLPPLVIAGRRGYRSEEVLAAIKAVSHNAPVQYLGEVDDPALRSLYRRAKLLLYVSLYEGFGFPILEAMSKGLPVVTSKNSAMEEVCGAAGILVEPEREDSIADAIRRACEDEDLRQQLISCGIERAASFSWRQSASAHAALYRRLAGVV